MSTRNLYLKKIKSVQRAQCRRRAVQATICAAIAAGFVGFGLRGLPTLLAAVIALLSAAVGKTGAAAQVLAGLPGSYWWHLGGFLASITAGVGLHRRHYALASLALDTVDQVIERRRARRDRDSYTARAAAKEALRDLGQIRHLQVVLGSSLAASPILTSGALGQTLESLARDVERELGESARYLGFGPD